MTPVFLYWFMVSCVTSLPTWKWIRCDHADSLSNVQAGGDRQKLNQKIAVSLLWLYSLAEASKLHDWVTRIRPVWIGFCVLHMSLAFLYNPMVMQNPLKAGQNVVNCMFSQLSSEWSQNHAKLMSSTRAFSDSVEGKASPIMYLAVFLMLHLNSKTCLLLITYGYVIVLPNVYFFLFFKVVSRVYSFS